MQIINAAVHQLLKTAQVKGCTAKLAPQPMAVDSALTELVQAIVETYNKRTSQRTGSFGPMEHHVFPAALDDYVEKRTPFYEFTTWALEQLRLRIAEELFANGGYLFLCHYKVTAGQYFLVAKLTSSSGAAFDDTLTHAVPSIYLNVRELQQVGRVSIEGWRSNAKKHLTFVSAREGGHASDYFVNFLGCVEVASNTVETQKLVKVMHAFCDEQKLEEQQSAAFRQRVFDYARTIAAGMPMSLALMANAAWPDKPSTLIEFINGHEDAPTDDIVTTPNALRKLINWRFAMKGMTINMSDQFKLTHKVAIKSGKNLVIHDVSDEIIQQLTADD